MIRKALIVLPTVAAVWTLIEFGCCLIMGDADAPHPLVYKSESGWTGGYYVSNETVSIGVSRKLPPGAPIGAGSTGQFAGFGYITGV